jgi:hypothetical protein
MIPCPIPLFCGDANIANLTSRTLPAVYEQRARDHHLPPIAFFLSHRLDVSSQSSANRIAQSLLSAAASVETIVTNGAEGFTRLRRLVYVAVR